MEKANLKEEDASRKKKKEKSKSASNNQTPTFLWNNEISSQVFFTYPIFVSLHNCFSLIVFIKIQLDNCKTKTKGQEIEEYTKFSAEPLQAMFQVFTCFIGEFHENNDFFR